MVLVGKALCALVVALQLDVKTSLKFLKLNDIILIRRL
jgi:hypothetical protein